MSNMSDGSSPEKIRALFAAPAPSRPSPRVASKTQGAPIIRPLRSSCSAIRILLFGSVALAGCNWASRPPQAQQKESERTTDRGTIEVVDLEIDLEPIYGALFLAYRSDPIGSAVIHNRGETALQGAKFEFSFDGEGTESFLVEPYTVEIPTMAPGKSESFSISPKLSQQIVSDYTREFTAKGRVYSSSGSQLAEVRRAVFIYNRKSFDWKNADRIAAFIDPDDPAVRAIIRKAWEYRPDTSKAEFPPANVVSALAILTAVCKLNLKYMPDAENTLSRSQGEVIDSVKLPWQTIIDGGGDCDDLAVLCCSLLEAGGVPTVFALGRDHALFLVEIGARPQNIEGVWKTDTVVIHSERAWLPIESTALATPASSFRSAWAAAWTRIEALNSKAFELVVVQRAWTRYHPMQRPPEFSVTRQIETRLDTFGDFSSEIEGELAGLRGYLADLLESGVKEIQSTHTDPFDRNTAIGLLYVRGGLLDAASVAFENAIFSDSATGAEPPNSLRDIQQLRGVTPAKAHVLSLLAICHSLNGDLATAADCAQAALKGFPADAMEIRGENMLRLALFNRLQGKLSSERKWLEGALQLDPSLESVYQGLVAGDGTVASERNRGILSYLRGELR